MQSARFANHATYFPPTVDMKTKNFPASVKLLWSSSKLESDGDAFRLATSLHADHANPPPFSDRMSYRGCGIYKESACHGKRSMPTQTW